MRGAHLRRSAGAYEAKPTGSATRHSAFVFACSNLPILAFSQILASLALLVLMLGALYTHYMLGAPPQKFGGAAVLLGLILVKLYCAITGSLSVSVKIKTH